MSKRIGQKEKTSETMRTWIAKSTADFAQLETSWSDLEQRCSARPFSSFRWANAWSQSKLEMVKPYVIGVENAEGELVGLAPFHEGTLNCKYGPSYKVLRLYGEPDGLTEYAGWLALPDAEEAVYDAVASTLAKQADWDLAYMPYLDKLEYKKISTGTNRHPRLRTRIRNCEFCGFDLQESLEEYLSLFSAKSRSRMRKTLKQFGGLSDYEFNTASTEDELLQGATSLIDLSMRRWDSVGKISSFANIPTLASFLEILMGSIDTSQIRLFYVKEGEARIAVQFGVVHNRIYYQIQEAFVPNISNLGNALRLHSIASLIDEGVKYYDFMAGVSEHKLRWHAKSMPGQHILLIRDSLKNLPFIHTKLWPTGRFTDFVPLV